MADEVGPDILCAFCAVPLRVAGLSILRPTNLDEAAEEGGEDGFRYISLGKPYLKCYDPRVVTRQSVEWLRQSKIVGYNSALRQ